jgi:hypothetical protein
LFQYDCPVVVERDLTKISDAYDALSGYAPRKLFLTFSPGVS